MAARLHDTHYMPVHAAKQLALAAPGGAPDDARLEARVTTVEHQFVYLRRDADDIKIELRELGTRVGAVETAIGKLSTKLDAVAESTVSGIEALETKLDLKLAAQESKTSGRFDSLSAAFDRLEMTMNAGFDRIEQRFTHVPTKLQLALWGGGVVLTLFLGSLGVIAFLLRMNGQPVAAGAMDAMMGK